MTARTEEGQRGFRRAEHEARKQERFEKREARRVARREARAAKVQSQPPSIGGNK